MYWYPLPWRRSCLTLKIRSMVFGCRPCLHHHGTPMEYYPIAEKYCCPIVVAGFEPIDLCYRTFDDRYPIGRRDTRVENQYMGSVHEAGNSVARKTLNDVFEVADKVWRRHRSQAQRRLWSAGSIQRFNASDLISTSIQLMKTKLHQWFHYERTKKPMDCPQFWYQNTGRNIRSVHPWWKQWRRLCCLLPLFFRLEQPTIEVSLKMNLECRYLPQFDLIISIWAMAAVVFLRTSCWQSGVFDVLKKSNARSTTMVPSSTCMANWPSAAPIHTWFLNFFSGRKYGTWPFTALSNDLAMCCFCATLPFVILEGLAIDGLRKYSCPSVGRLTTAALIL